MAAMEAKKSKEKDAKPAGAAAGVGRGRGATKEVGRPSSSGGNAPKGNFSHRYKWN